ncbi:MAG: zinc-ribbon domain-containing protein [Bacilli bacterium]
MKFCSKCGKELADDDIYCTACGNKVGHNQTNDSSSSDVVYQDVLTISNSDNKKEKPEFAIVVKVFMIISTVFCGFFIIPLAWMIPMTVHAFRCMDNNEKMTTGFKVCSLLFVSVIAGIFMLIDENM